MDTDKIIKETAKGLSSTELYSDLLKPSIGQVGKTCQNILKFVSLPFSFLGMTADELEKKYKAFISSTLNKVPNDKVEAPSPLVAGPLLEHVKYVFDNKQEKRIEDMFSELLANASNSSLKAYAQPSYVYSLQQLTWIEAEILNLIYEKQIDDDCLGIAFTRYCDIESCSISVESNVAEPLVEHYDEEPINVFYLYNVLVIEDGLSVSSSDLERSLNILQQLNLISKFQLNKFVSRDLYSLAKHDAKHLKDFDPRKCITAYTLTPYANDMMLMCINPKENPHACFKCTKCGALFQNAKAKIKVCPFCHSSEIELSL